MIDHKKFFGEGWVEQFSPFLLSREYKQIGAYLQDLDKQGVLITPSLKHIFRCFLECPWHKLHTIILAMDPYPGLNPDNSSIADGLAFSARESKDAPKSLNSIYEAIDDCVFKGEYTPRGSWNRERNTITHGLMHWANDGILLLNCSLTTIVGRSNEHMNIWRPFVEYVMHDTCRRRDSLGVVLIGSHARDFKKYVTKNPTIEVFECEHPAAAGYQKRPWKHNGVFGSLTEFHSKTNNIKIDW